jgi:hypothetical protein
MPATGLIVVATIAICFAEMVNFHRSYLAHAVMGIRNKTRCCKYIHERHYACNKPFH